MACKDRIGSKEVFEDREGDHDQWEQKEKKDRVGTK